MQMGKSDPTLDADLMQLVYTGSPPALTEDRLNILKMQA